METLEETVIRQFKLRVIDWINKHDDEVPWFYENIRPVCLVPLLNQIMPNSILAIDRSITGIPEEYRRKNPPPKLCDGEIRTVYLRNYLEDRAYIWWSRWRRASGTSEAKERAKSAGNN